CRPSLPLVAVAPGNRVHRDRTALLPADDEQPRFRWARGERLIRRRQLGPRLLPSGEGGAARGPIDVPKHPVDSTIFAMMPPIIDDVIDHIPSLTRTPQDPGVVAIYEHAAGTLPALFARHHRVQVPRSCDLQPLHAARESTLICGLHDQVSVLALEA